MVKKQKYNKRALTIKGYSIADIAELVKTMTRREIAEYIGTTTKTVDSFLYKNKIKSGKKDSIEIYPDARTLVKSEYTWSAKKRGYEFTLTDEEFYSLIIKPCVYCGRERTNSVSWNRKRKLKTDKEKLDFYYTGIDRKDNDKGYTLENSVSCCKTCNYAKTNCTLEQFNEWLIALVRYQSSLSN